MIEASVVGTLCAPFASAGVVASARCHPSVDAALNVEWQIGRRYLGLETLATLKQLAPVLQLPQTVRVEGDAP